MPFAEASEFSFEFGGDRLQNILKHIVSLLTGGTVFELKIKHTVDLIFTVGCCFATTDITLHWGLEGDKKPLPEEDRRELTRFLANLSPEL